MKHLFPGILFLSTSWYSNLLPAPDQEGIAFQLMSHTQTKILGELEKQTQILAHIQRLAEKEHETLIRLLHVTEESNRRSMLIHNESKSSAKEIVKICEQMEKLASE